MPKYQGRIVEVVEFLSADGKRSFEKARRAPGVRLIIPAGDEILLTREYRQELNDYDYRLPGGKVFNLLDNYSAFLKSGADLLGPATEKAKDEGREEAGIIISGLYHMYTSKLGATMEWDLYYFVVTDYINGDQAPEQGEDIKVVKVSRDEAKKMCLDGRIGEERSALMLLRYFEKSE